ncbi:DUF6088 family protein [Aquincola sp. MAHUQ-54]|uniref:DUF6088 family protein n=1 Tax=Aquincola agrisoli TaxID=3119538 RepID=A0AAW9QLS1_9BURK
MSSRFGVRMPSAEKVVQALAAQAGEMVAPHGGSAANALGLTQQVPIREVYVTTGRTRVLKLGRAEVVIKHAPVWMFSLGSGAAGAAVRALAWMGPAHAAPSLKKLRRTLPLKEWRAWFVGAPPCLYGWRRRSAKKRFAPDQTRNIRRTPDIYCAVNIVGRQSL